LRYWDEIDRTLEEHHVALVSVTEPFDTTTPIGQAMQHIMRTFARLERDLAAARTRDVQAYRKAHLQPHGPIPFGFLKQGDRLVPVPD